MGPLKWGLGFFFTFLVFILIDLAWLGFAAKNLYQRQIGHLMAKKVNWTAAIIFYLLFVAGVILFAVMPALEKNSIGKALFLGACLGGLTYATYDLTNLATLKSWPVKIVWIDICWGVFLTANVSAAGFFIFKWLSHPA